MGFGAFPARCRRARFSLQRRRFNESFSAFFVLAIPQRSWTAGLAPMGKGFRQTKDGEVAVCQRTSPLSQLFIFSVIVVVGSVAPA